MWMRLGLCQAFLQYVVSMSASRHNAAQPGSGLTKPDVHENVINFIVAALAFWMQ